MNAEAARQTEEAAQRAGYPSVAVMKKELKKAERAKQLKREEQDRKYREEHRRKKTAPLAAKAELAELLSFQEGHPDRLRVAIKDRELGGRLVRENNEVTQRILKLREEIKKLEKY